MKKSIIKITMYTIATLLLIVIGCETTTETFNEFTKDGEVVYVGRPDTVIVAPSGLDKSRFFVALNADPKINKGKMRNLSGATVYEFDVDRGSLVDNILEFELDLEEGDYTYDIVLEDGVGNTSVRREVQFRVYGPKYQATLIPRSLQTIQATDAGTTLKWGDVQPTTLFSTLVYEDLTGAMKTLEVANDIEETVLEDHKLGGVLSVTSSYKPTDNALTSFESLPFETSEFLLDKSLIEIVSLSGDVSPDGCHGLPLSNIFDGTDDVWHNCGADTPSDYPFVQTFDLGVTAQLSQFKLFERGDCCQERSPAKFQIWGTDDITDAETVDIKTAGVAEWEADAISKGWVMLLDVNGNNQTTFEVNIPVEGSPKVRYFRMVVFEAINGGADANYAEYTLWATDIE